MATAKVSDATVREVLRLHDTNLEPIQIAQILNLKKIQVTSIIAHAQMSSDSNVSRSEGSDFPDRIQATDIPEASAQEQQQVEELAKSGLEPAQARSGLLVGEDVEFGDMIHWEPENSALVPNPHLMIVGESGSGKTYSVQCLIAEMAQRGIPAVVFDYGQGFEATSLDRTFVKHAKPREYLLGEEGVSLNPLRIFSNDIHGPKSVAGRLSDVFDAVYSLGPIQKKVLIDAILRSFDRCGIKTDSKSTWDKPAPTVSALQNVLEGLADDKDYANSKNALGLTARLTTFFMLSSFRSDGSEWSWDHFLTDPDHSVHVLQFRGLEGKTQRVLVEVLLWHLFFYLKSSGQQELRLYCVLDEAHHLSFRDGGPIDQLLREARKFGLGIIFASQQPEDFSQAAFSNTASKLVFQMADPGLKVSRVLAAKCLNYDSAEEIHELVATMPKGEALFITQNRGHRVRITDLMRRSTLWGRT